MTKDKTSFEDSLRKLERIVEKLEDGEMDLEASLTLFEEGISLTRECQERLTAAERRIEMLTAGADGSGMLSSISDSETTEK